MYAGQLYDYDGDGTPEALYKDAGYGPYTHYVDNTHPSSTDTNNLFGTPEKPRKSYPATLPAGSVVEIHNGFNSNGSVNYFRGDGTAQKPIFIRGADPANKVKFAKTSRIYGSYVIVENIDLDNWTKYYDCGFVFNFPNDHTCLRHCEIRNGPLATSSAIAVVSWTPGTSSHIVVYDVQSHDNGSWWNPAGDEDNQGIAIGGTNHHVWVVDNELYHNSGDGLQINGSPDTHHLYVGRNVCWENKQVGIGTKRSSDLIVSQNIVFNHKPSDSSLGAGVSFIYGPERVWFLFNRLYNNTMGVQGGSNKGDGLDGKTVGIIGNLIESTSGGPGINIWGNYGLDIYILNNTITRAQSGICGQQSGAMYLYNNIVSTLTMDSSSTHISVLYGTMAAPSGIDHNLFYQNGQPLTLNWGGSVYQTLGQFQTSVNKGQACREGDPMFKNAAGGDFQLKMGSPAIDAGTVHPVYQTFKSLYGIDIAVDFKGISRPGDAGWDMGAYECY
jgi:hypothetical protein